MCFARQPLPLFLSLSIAPTAKTHTHTIIVAIIRLSFIALAIYFFLPLPWCDPCIYFQQRFPIGHTQAKAGGRSVSFPADLWCAARGKPTAAAAAADGHTREQLSAQCRKYGNCTFLIYKSGGGCCCCCGEMASQAHVLLRSRSEIYRGAGISFSPVHAHSLIVRDAIGETDFHLRR